MRGLVTRGAVFILASGPEILATECLGIVDSRPRHIRRGWSLLRLRGVPRRGADVIQENLRRPGVSEGEQFEII